MRNMGAYITPKRLIAEATVTASPTAVVIDRSNTNNNKYDAIELAMHVGAGGITFTGVNFIALKLEDSDDGSTYANVVMPTNGNSPVVRSLVTAAAGAPTFGQDPDSNGYVRLINAAKAAADTDPFGCSYIGDKRYLRVTIVMGGTHSTGTLVGLYAVLGFPLLLPAA
jgi:hypothetical protein